MATKEKTGKNETPPNEEGSERREQILEAALNVISKKGFDGTRTKEIALEAGVSEALVFKHFKTKESILEALSGLVMRKIVAPLVLQSVRDVIAEKRDAPLRELFESVLTDRLDLVRKNQKLMKTFIFEASRRPALLKTINKELIPEIVKVFEFALRPRMESGELPKGLNIHHAAQSAIGIVVSYVIGCEIAPDLFGKADDRRAIPRLVSQFLHGILAGSDKGAEHE
jgi:AcrR family transcriptional regulator